MKNKKRIKEVSDFDVSDDQVGFIYYGFIIATDRKDRKEDRIKFGCSLNPIFRIAQHYYVNYPRDFYPMRVVKCWDYLRCEVEIKKIFSGKEIIPRTTRNERIINKIIDKYKWMEMNMETMFELFTTNDVVNKVKKYGKD